MKKMMLACTLILSGVIGFVGMLIAAVGKVERASSSRIFGCLRGVDWLPVVIFVVMAAAGILLAVKEIKGENFGG